MKNSAKLLFSNELFLQKKRERRGSKVGKRRKNKQKKIEVIRRFIGDLISYYDSN